jgi:hypothetical protein
MLVNVGRSLGRGIEVECALDAVADMAGRNEVGGPVVERVRKRQDVVPLQPKGYGSASAIDDAPEGEPTVEAAIPLGLKDSISGQFSWPPPPPEDEESCRPIDVIVPIALRGPRVLGSSR